MSEEKPAEGATEAAPKKSKKKLIIIVAVVLVIAIGGGAFAMLGGSPKPEGEAEEVEKEEVVHYETLALDPFIVNLTENSSFLKVSILLEYDPRVLESEHKEGSGGGHGGGGSGGGHAGGGEPAGPPGVFGTKQAHIRDSVIRVLSSKKAAEVLSVQGKEDLKEELIEAINEATGLDEPLVVAIYFTEFIVQ